MNIADTQWVFVITAFILGAGLGALAYHLMNANVAHSIKIRHQLTERELEVNQLREGLNDHFSRTADGLASLSKQLDDMQDQVRKDAKHLCDDESVIKRLTNQAESEADNEELDAPTDPVKKPVEPPRDYAAGTSRGTLSEDYGLKPEVFEPPRN
ncbi:hypothetical protein SAMN05660443_1278 [Marinospirillum celere]|uniref:Z-ring associated protein G n=1 Tax=Marinospirillum celere TaxID=1122252 RepID=A0A1I1FY11_9GAMM|nr:DUF1043 family protein [Marinospirillum celere]SFC04185.1 hypothetical protein SAMN05660443_1278 [Marinospirillum celere]